MKREEKGGNWGRNPRKSRKRRRGGCGITAGDGSHPGQPQMGILGGNFFREMVPEGLRKLGSAGSQEFHELSPVCGAVAPDPADPGI